MLLLLLLRPEEKTAASSPGGLLRVSQGGKQFGQEVDAPVRELPRLRRLPELGIGAAAA